MTRRFFSFGLYLLAFLLVAAALLTTLASYMLKDLKYYTEATLKLVEAKTGYAISLTDINWSIAKGAGLQIDNLRITDARSQALLLSVRKARILTSLAPLLKKRISVSRFILDEPEIHVVRATDGSWQLPMLPPLQAVEAPGWPAAFDCALIFKRLYVSNGRILFNDNLRGTATRADKVNVTLEFDRRTRLYALSADASMEAPEASGMMRLQGTLLCPAHGFNPDTLTGDFRILLKSIALDAFLPYLQETPFASARSRLDADLFLNIRPGLRLAGTCRMTAPMLSGMLASGRPLNLDGSSIEFAFQRDAEGLRAEKLSIGLPDGVILKGRCRVSDAQKQQPLADLALSAATFDLSAIKRYLAALGALAPPYQSLLERLSQGRVAVEQLHIRQHLGPPWTFPPSVLQATLAVKDVTLATWEQAPALTISDGLLQLDTDKLQGTLHVCWPDTDNHTVLINVPGLFHAPAPEVTIDSKIAAQSITTVLPVIAKAPASGSAILSVSGTITARSRLSYQPSLHITSELDLTQAGYQITDLIAKPAGIGNRLFLEWRSGIGPGSAPLQFNLLLEDKAEISGMMTGWSQPSLKGSYTLKGLDLSTLALPSIPSDMLLRGILNGSGTLTYPPLSASQNPIEGTVALQGFSLFDREADAALIGGDLHAVLAQQQVEVTARSGHVGLTELGFTGTLTKILPPAGRLSIEAGTLDIDQFVQVIQRIEQIGGRQTESPGLTKPGIFRRTDLDMDLHAQRINFLRWNGDNATAAFTFKSGSMRWDDISIHTDNGTIHGSVVFDFSLHPLRTLTLAPTRSDVDFLWCVPQLRKGETITGTTNLSGEFSSTFHRAIDILPNMQGRFHIDIAGGEIKKFAFFSKILTMLNIPRLFELKLPDFMSQGMPFDLMTADFTMQNKIMHTENLIMKGPAMNLSAVGNINLDKEEIDLIIAAQPLETLGKIMDKIPVAKGIFTGKDKSLTVGYFDVKGPYADASVRPLPLKSLSKAVRKIFNTIFYIPREILAPQPKEDNDSN